jgi:hypothetical protein
MLTYVYLEDCWSLFSLAFHCFNASLTNYEELFFTVEIQVSTGYGLDDQGEREFESR